MTKETHKLWRAVHCSHCDFSSGQRGMDSCSKCRGAGSVLVFSATGDHYPNTREGWVKMIKAHPEIPDDE